MVLIRILFTALLMVAVSAVLVIGETTITIKIAGDGAVNDSTIKVGEPVSVDIFWDNEDDDRRGFTTGFEITSPDSSISTIIHVPDSGNGENANGDIKAHNNWGGSKTWDFGGLRVVTVHWDGELPDEVGFGGLRVKKQYDSHPIKKVLSWTMIVPETGTIMIDSSFFAPGGVWVIVGPDGIEIPPGWGGPYKFNVVK